MLTKVMTPPEPGISDALCQFVANSKFERLPETTREAAARVTLDATGVMLGASGLSHEARAFVDLATRQGSPGPCSIVGYGDSVTAPLAALANGALAHALDFEDAFDPAPSHPNAASIPAAIAIAQAFGPVPGRDFITAIAVGCDLVCRLGLSLGRPMEHGGWYPPPILGTFGATAVAARLLGLDARQTRDALSLALCQATMPGEIKHSEGTVIRAVREAVPAQAAVLSALLARSGVSGFESPLEGKAGFFALFAGGEFDPDVLLEDLGERFWIERLSFKPWPACRGTHPFIQVALDLLREHSFDWRDIESVNVEISDVQRMLVEPEGRKREPQSAIDAKFSIPYTVAAALVRGEVGLSSFGAAMLADRDVLELARRVKAEPRPGWGRQKAASGALAVRLRDGRTLSGIADPALGHPDAPLDTDELVAKFAHCCEFAIKPRDARQARASAIRLLDMELADDSGALFRL